MESRPYLGTVLNNSFDDFYRQGNFCDVILVTKEDRVEVPLPMDPNDLNSTVQSSLVACVGHSVAIREEPPHNEIRSHFLPTPGPSRASTARVTNDSNEGIVREERDSSILISNSSNSTDQNTTTTSSVFSHDHKPTGTSTPLSQSRIMHVDTTEFERPRTWSKRCHKIVLAKNSSFLKHFLEQAADIEIAQHQQGQRPSYHSQSADGSELAKASMVLQGERSIMKVELKNTRASSLQIILNFIYTGNFDFNHKTFGNVLKDAEELKFDGVVKYCHDFLNQSLDCSNCISILLCSKSSQQTDVYEASFEFIEKNFSGTYKESPQDWIQKIPYEILQSLLDSSGLIVDSEEDLFKMLISWVKNDEKTRSHHLYSLMKPRIQNLSAEFLMKVLAQTEVVRNMQDISCLRLITDTAAVKMPSTPKEKDESRKQSAASIGSLVSTSSIGSSVFRSSNSGSGDNTSGSPSLDDETLCVFGSNGIHEILESKEWKNWQERNLGHSFEVVMVQDNLLVIGGCKGDEITARVEIYNFSSKIWSKGPSLNKSRDNFAICVMNSNLVFVFGGTVNRKGTAITNSCEMLDFSKSFSEDAGTSFVWKDRSPMALQKYRCKSASVSDNAFVIGGQTGRLGSGKSVEDFATRVLPDVEKFHKNQWSPCAPMNEARSNFGIATLDDKIYVCGGWRDMNIINTCERFDPEQNVWEPISSLKIPRQSCSMSAFRGRIVIIGCFGPNGWTNCTEVYNPHRNKWSTGPSLENQQTRPKCIKVNRKFLED